MPPIRTSRNRKPPPAGFEDIEDTLLGFNNKMKDAENAPHDGKKKHEMLWPIFQISHQREWPILVTHVSFSFSCLALRLLVHVGCWRIKLIRIAIYLWFVLWKTSNLETIIWMASQKQLRWWKPYCEMEEARVWEGMWCIKLFLLSSSLLLLLLLSSPCILHHM